MKTIKILGATVFLATLFTVAASGEIAPVPGTDMSAQNDAAGAVLLVAVEGPHWGVEFETEMRRDIKALTGFVTQELAPLMGRQKEAAGAAAGIARFDALLRGQCGGVSPGLADYAWALNHTLAQALPLFTALEAIGERDAQFVMPAQNGAPPVDAVILMARFEDHYRRAARWLDDMNMAFGAAYPAAVAAIEAQRERGMMDGALHENAEADIYINGYPFAGIAPLRNPAAIFMPYAAVKIIERGVGPVCP